MKKDLGLIDVAVLGAGPAGSACAADLSRRGLRVALVDRLARPQLQVGESAPPELRPLMERLGVWEQFTKDGHLPSMGNESQWGSTSLTSYDFIFSPYGMGWHLDRLRFDQMLTGAAAEAGAEYLSGCSFHHAGRYRAGTWQLTFTGESGDTSLEARFVVDATGHARAFASRRGARRTRIDELVAIIAYGHTNSNDRAQRAVTLVETAKDGWWYSAPLPGGKIVIMYMTDARKMSRSEWTEKLKGTEHTYERIAGCVLDSRLRTVCADSSFLEMPIGNAWMAVGDAAAAYDPLSSRGICSAIAGGLEAAETIFLHFDQNVDASSAYAQRIRRSYASYLHNRAAYYRMEQRWPDSSFWRIRQKKEENIHASMLAGHESDTHLSGV